MVNLVGELESISAAFCERIQENRRFAAVFGGQPTEREYVDWFLVDSFYDVLGTPRYCATGGTMLQSRADFGPALRAVSEKLQEKSVEERTETGDGHEVWALRDVGAVRGWSVDQAAEWMRQQTPSPGSTAYNEFFRFVAETCPIAILGLAFPREYLSDFLAGRAAKNLRENSNIPNIALAVQFLGAHGEADTGHVQSLYPVLAAIEQELDREAVVMAARVSVETYLSKAFTAEK